MPSVRTYHCRGCKKTAEGELPPKGWFSLAERQSRTRNGKNFDWTRRGLYCCLGCLEDTIPMLAQDVVPVA